MTWPSLRSLNYRATMTLCPNVVQVRLLPFWGLCSTYRAHLKTARALAACFSPREAEIQAEKQSACVDEPFTGYSCHPWLSPSQKGDKARCCPPAAISHSHKTLQEPWTKATNTPALKTFLLLPKVKDWCAEELSLAPGHSLPRNTQSPGLHPAAISLRTPFSRPPGSPSLLCWI